VPLADPPRPASARACACAYYSRQLLAAREVERGDGVTPMKGRGHSAFKGDGDGIAAIPIVRAGPVVLAIDHASRRRDARARRQPISTTRRLRSSDSRVPSDSIVKRSRRQPALRSCFMPVPRADAGHTVCSCPPAPGPGGARRSRRLDAEAARLSFLSADIQRRSWPHRLGPNLRSNGFQVLSSISCPPQPYSTKKPDGFQV